MAIIVTDLLHNLGLLRVETSTPDLTPDLTPDFTEDCLWCLTSGSGRCPHQVASVVEGVVCVESALGFAGDRLARLPERLARAIVTDGPRPLECHDLPGGDRLVAAAEAAWRPWQDAFRRDPDVDGWAAVLQDRLGETFAAWLFGTLCTLSGGTLHRLDEPNGGERWIAAEPDLLAAEVEACWRGEGGGGPFAGDPLCRATRPGRTRASA